MRKLCVYDECVSFGDSVDVFIQLEFVSQGRVTNKVIAWPKGFELTDKEIADDLFDVVKDLATVRIFDNGLNLRSIYMKEGL